MPSLRLVFAGTPAFAATHLQALLRTRHRVLAVYTQPDRPAGRGNQLVASPVKALAVAHDIPIFQPRTLKDAEAQQQLRQLHPDLLVVVAYGLLLPQAVLDIPVHGCINVHASLLPRWRGAAPIERALLAGDAETGVTIMRMDAGLDTGAMLYKTSVNIGPDDTRMSLEEKLAQLGVNALLHVLDNLADCLAHAEVQDSGLATYAAKLEKSEAQIDWTASATVIDRQIRAGIGRNPAYAILGDQRVRVLAASPLALNSGKPPGTITDIQEGCLLVACGNGSLRIRELQLPGKNPASVAALLNAYRQLLYPGNRFSLPGSTAK